MKVVHLAPFFQAGYAGGIQRYVAELARVQRDEGVDASVLTLRLPGIAGEGCSDCAHGLPVAGRTAAIVWQRTPVHPLLLRDVRAIDADVVHLHAPSPSMEAALLLAPPRRGRLVVTVHNDLPRTTGVQRALGSVERSLLGRVLRRAGAVIAPHETFARQAIPSGLVDGRLHIVPPGVDHCLFSPAAGPQQPDTVVFAGHVRPEKGLHILIDAMARLPDARLEVLASVSYEAAYYHGVRNHAIEHLGERVRFRLDPSRLELAEAYRRAACVVVPSVGLESWNLVLLEAAASGAACVRTDLPGLAWADFAEVAPAGDAAALASAIERAIENREVLGCRALERAHDYSWHRTCRETLAVYAAAGA